MKISAARRPLAGRLEATYRVEQPQPRRPIAAYKLFKAPFSLTDAVSQVLRGTIHTVSGQRASRDKDWKASMPCPLASPNFRQSDRGSLRQLQNSASIRSFQPNYCERCVLHPIEHDGLLVERKQALHHGRHLLNRQARHVHFGQRPEVPCVSHPFANCVNERTAQRRFRSLHAIEYIIAGSADIGIDVAMTRAEVVRDVFLGGIRHRSDDVIHERHMHHVFWESRSAPQKSF